MKFRVVKAGATLALALLMGVLLMNMSACDPCSSCGGGTRTATPTKTPPPSACSGQGLMGIDPVHNIGYAPLIATDSSGNAQVAVIDLSVGAANPILKTISLTGAQEAVASTYDSVNQQILVEAFAFDVGTAGVTDVAPGVNIFVIATSSQSVTSVVPASGLSAGRGGVVDDPNNNRAFVAGESDIGILDTSQSPPAWSSTSIVETVCSDSLAFNLNTGILFISCDGDNDIIDTTTLPLVPQALEQTGEIDDGVAFDVTTNIAVLSPEFEDNAHVYNFNSLDTTVTPATADILLIPGLGTGEVFGEGPGGEAVANCTTHQAITAGEDDQNFKLIQMPSKPVSASTPLNNNGQPGSGTSPDAASAYEIAAAVTPLGPSEQQLFIQGDPNGITIDPEHNFFYALATDGEENQFLIRIDLTTPTPPLGGNPNGPTTWVPAGATTVIPLP
ncbi:MAG TPA: hypothetical protein VMU16_15825 [Candidatus Binataceae bacterium]|nr:hypothetical protein [Candidatus Binataceae bacterium]